MSFLGPTNDDATSPPPPGPPTQAPIDPTGSSDLGIRDDLLYEPQRQSLWAILFLALKTIRSIGIVQVVLGAGFVLSQSPSILVLVLVVLAVGAVFLLTSALSWWRYTFMVREGELRVDRGVLSREALTVPLDRVQSVSIEQKFLHRFVNLVEVSLDTAGTESAEFTFDAVDRDIAVALQAVAADYRIANPQPALVGAGQESALHPTATEQVGEREVLRHSPARLLRIALTRLPFSGLIVLGPLIAVGDDLIDFIPFDLPEIELELGLWLLWAIPLALLAVAVFGVLLNVISTLLRDWNLRVTQTASGLRREAGLLSTTSVASSVSRVQSIQVRQNPLERLFGLHQVTLNNIGEGDFLVPGCTDDEVALIRDLGLDDRTGVESVDRRVSPSEIFRSTRNAAISLGIATVVLFFPIGGWALLVLSGVPITYFLSRRSVRRRRWGIDGDSVVLHDELFGWNRHEALLRKANGVSISQSYFERSRGLATIQFRLAGGILTGSISIGMIPLEEAQAVRDLVLYVVETDNRVFM